MQSPTNSAGKLNLSVRLFEPTADCGDLSDDATGAVEQTRSSRLAETASIDSGGGIGSVDTLGPAESGDRGVGPAAQTCGAKSTHCDGTADSGRQLDLCGVCGGSCLPPSCVVQACPELNPLFIRLRCS